MEREIDPDKVAQLCFEFYQKALSTKSKPKENEWTNLAAILLKSILIDCF